MANWTTYKGLTVPTSTTGDAGGYLSSNLEALADRVGPCNFTATTNPNNMSDINAGYQVGSFWVNTSTNTWFVCVNNAPGAAIWNTFDSTTTPEPANTALMGPASGSAAAPTFRALVAADLPAATGTAIGGVSVPSSGGLTVGSGAISVNLGGGEGPTNGLQIVGGQLSAATDGASIGINGGGQLTAFTANGATAGIVGAHSGSGLSISAGAIAANVDGTSITVNSSNNLATIGISPSITVVTKTANYTLAAR